jgi:hypothetical protein
MKSRQKQEAGGRLRKKCQQGALGAVVASFLRAVAIA